MHLAFLLALGAQLCWSVSNLIDKHITERYLRATSMGASLVITGLFVLCILPFAWLFVPLAFEAEWRTVVFALACSAVYSAAILAYYHALLEGDASVVVPLYQIGPAFAVAFGYLVLGEALAAHELVGAAIVMIGAVLLSMRWNGRKSSLRWRAVSLVLLSSALFSASGLFFKMSSGFGGYGAAIFWNFVGVATVGLMGLLIRPWREGVSRNLGGANGRVFVLVNVVNEIINDAGELLYRLALTMAPLGVVAVAGGLHPVMLFALGGVLSVIWPKFIKEDIERRTLWRKFAAVVVIGIGTYLVNI